MLPIEYLFAFSMETESYLSYRHSRIPEVFKGPGIIYMPKTERVSVGCYQHGLVDLEVSHS